MASGTLLANAALATAMACLFAYAGALMMRRDVEDPAGRRAVQRFSIFWWSIALLTLLEAARLALAGVGNLDLTLHWTLSTLGAIPLVALLWGLVSYLAYIYTGSSRALSYTTALHVAILAFYAFIVATLEPRAVTAEAWSAPLHYATDPSPALTAGILLTILLPTLAAAIAYATLFSRTSDPGARYRIAMTSGAFLLWFGAAAIAAPTPLNDWYWWPLVARGIGLVATLMVLAAYQPPARLRARFGIPPLALRSRGQRPRRPRAAPFALPA